jgi:hypothetical protein
MKRNVLPLLIAFSFAWPGFSFAESSVDELIQKLEDKGILNAQEAAQLKDNASTKEEDSQQKTFKTMLPDWINGIKITGDMRLRYQEQERKDPVVGGIWPHDRGRVRARLNIEDQINDKFKFVFGIGTDGTGGNNGSGVQMYNFSRSNNYSFGGNGANTTTQPSGNFAKDFIVLNKAYGEYKPNADWTIDVGKMDNPLWEPSSISGEKFLWDPNITPEGGSINYQKKINDSVTFFTTNTLFVLDDTGHSALDEWMYDDQVGIKGNVTEKTYFKLAGTWQGINNQDHQIGGQRSSDLTNTTLVSSGADATSTKCAPNFGTTLNSITNCYEYSYNALIAAVDLGINDPFGEMLPSFINIPQVGVRGEYIRNPESMIPSDQKNGWEMGWYLGNSALNGWGTWQLSMDYRVLEKDAEMDIFPDFDQYTGDTDIAGYRTELDVGIAKNVWMDFNFFDFHMYKPFVNDALLEYGGKDVTDTNAAEFLFQIDLNMKF